MLELWRNRLKRRLKKIAAADLLSEEGMIDIHCRMLPNVDDGPDSLTESLNMACISRCDFPTLILPVLLQR